MRDPLPTMVRAKLQIAYWKFGQCQVTESPELALIGTEIRPSFLEVVGLMSGCEVLCFNPPAL
ncbi:MAG: hypothetical protein V7L29_29100 [Nostoc sp.]|uniref:hypothetical protein n=1 Tax=Nostoc sp. TaxID=1180 RepID=UPI002FFC89D2